MSPLNLFLFGSPHLEKDGSVFNFGRRKSLALLAYMAVNPLPHGRDSLAALFWPEYDQTSARANLRRTLASVRKKVGGTCLEIHRESIQILCTPDLHIDVLAFKKQIQHWRDHMHPNHPCNECMAVLRQAVNFYKGDFLEGFSLRDCPEFDQWQLLQKEALQRDLAAALETLSDGYLQLGEYDPALTYAHRWLSLDPLHEPARRMLMRLYAWSGDRSAAVHQYEECEKVLKQELGVRPEEETRLLYQAILENSLKPFSVQKEKKATLPREKLRHNLQSKLKSNLPPQPIPFVGREELLAEIERKLEDPTCRLLTLVGPGGSGKTRLALEVGKRQIDHFQNGVFFVSLESLSSAEAIVPAIAEAIGFSFYKNERGEPSIKPKQQLYNYLAKKSLLLILDNYEHLLEGADIASGILHAAPQSMILATSRARLSLFEEQTFYVPGMQLPLVEQETVDELTVKEALCFNAITLFIQAAQWAQPGFELDTSNLAAVVRICRSVDGMPLGILLAAPWLSMFTLDEIAAEIEKNLEFLESELRDLPDRQRSLQAVFDRSWEILSQREQKVFAALSVFRGGSTREAVLQVTGANPRELLTLVNRSFIQNESNGRYTLHRLLHLYAAEQLAKDPLAQQVARERHSAFFANRLAGWEKDLKSARQGTALKQMDIESENCRAAWNTAVETRKISDMQKMLESLFLYYGFRSRIKEGEFAFRKAVDELANVTTLEGLCLRSGLLARQASILDVNASPEQIKLLFHQAEKILDDPLLTGRDVRKERADLLRLKGLTFDDSFYYAQARQWLEKSLEIYRELVDQWSLAEVLHGLGVTTWMSGDTMRALKYFEESITCYQEQGDLKGLGHALSRFGVFSVMTGKAEKGEKALRKAVHIQRQTGDPWELQFSLVCLGLYGLMIGKGDFSASQPLLEESIRVCMDNGIYGNHVKSANALALARLGEGSYAEAQDLARSALAIAGEAEYPRGICNSLHYLGYGLLAESSFPEALQCWEEAITLARGEYMPPYEYADLLVGLGIACCLNDKPDQAHEHIYTALQIHLETGSFQRLFFSFYGLSLLKSKIGQLEQAVELYAFTKARSPFVANAKYIDDIVGKRIRAAAANLPSNEMADAEGRGRARDPWQTARDLLAEFDSLAQDENADG